MAFPEELVYFVYALFALGILIIILTCIRLLWYCCVVRKEEKVYRKKFYDNPTYFQAHIRDPWLKDVAISNNRFYGNPDKESLRDVNLSEFIRTHRQEDARELSSKLNHSLAPENQTHIDDVTVQNQAHYEEPNTNLIIARKETLMHPEELSSLSYEDNLLVTSRSDEARAALSALDVGLANENVDTSFDDEERPKTPATPKTPHPDIATMNEPLPVDSEVYIYSSTVYVTDSTEL